VSFYASFDNIESQSVSITWGSAATLLNHDGSLLYTRQITNGALCTITYNGTNWVLVGAVDPVNGGVFIGNVGFGFSIDEEFNDRTPSDKIQIRLGKACTLVSSKNEDRENLQNYGMMLAKNSHGENYLTFIASSNGFSSCAGMVEDHYNTTFLLSGKPAETGIFQLTKWQMFEDLTQYPTEYYITNSSGYPKDIFILSNGNLYVVMAGTTFLKVAVHESTNKGVSFKQKFIDSSDCDYYGGDVLSDGTLCILTTDQNFVGPIKISYTMNGYDWVQNLNTIPLFSLYSNKIKPFKTLDGDIHVVGTPTSVTNSVQIYSSSSIDGVFSYNVEFPVLANESRSYVSCVHHDKINGKIYFGVEHDLSGFQDRHILYWCDDFEISASNKPEYLWEAPSSNVSSIEQISTSYDGSVFVNYGNYKVYKKTNNYRKFTEITPLPPIIGKIYYSESQNVLLYGFETASNVEYAISNDTMLLTLDWDDSPGQFKYTGNTFSFLSSLTQLPNTRPNLLKNIFQASLNKIRCISKNFEFLVKDGNGGLLIDNNGSVSMLGYFPPGYSMIKFKQTFLTNGKVEASDTVPLQPRQWTFRNAYFDDDGNIRSLYGGHSSKEYWAGIDSVNIYETTSTEYNPGEVITAWD
jgi:hypothetical protein